MDLEDRRKSSEKSFDTDDDSEYAMIRQIKMEPEAMFSASEDDMAQLQQDSSDLEVEPSFTLEGSLNGDYSNDGMLIEIDMDLREPLSTLRSLLENRLTIDLKNYSFWLQNAQMLESHKNLVDQCVQGEGLVQINVQIKPMQKHINIVDVLKPVDDYIKVVENNSPVSTAQENKRNVIKWMMDAQYKKEQERLKIPNDPRDWSEAHVKHWLQWVVRTISKKDEACANIAREYNENRAIIQTEKNLRSCWDNIKRDTRKYCAALKRESYKTGGGTVNVKKDEMFELVQEIMGETAVHGLNNPFDSDCIDNEKENAFFVIEISEEDDDNDPAQYLMKNKQISDWKTWDKQKLKSKISSLLKENIPTTSKNVKPTKRKLEDDKTLDEAKAELAGILKADIEEKRNYEIEILKAKLEKEKLKIDLLKIIKNKYKEQSDITFKL